MATGYHSEWTTKKRITWFAVKLYFEGKRFAVVYERYAEDEADAEGIGRSLAAQNHSDRILDRIEIVRSHR